MSRTVLVTGGAGFIGSHITQYCVEEGYEVKVIDDLSIGDRRNLAPVSDEIDFFEMDLRSDAIASVLADTDWVFHEAAIPSVARSFSIPIESSDVNVMGTINLFNHAQEADVDRVVFASSSSVYGDTEELPKVETMETNPKSPYAASKITCEIFGEVYAEQMDLDVIGLRYFNVFGPRQSPKTDYAAVVPNFIQALLSGESPVIYGDGEQSRDFTYVRDVVRANIRAAEDGRPGKSYNVGYNQQTTVNELLYELRRITGSQIDAEYDEPRPGDVRHSRADSQAFINDTGFEPKFTVEDGLRETVDWFEAHPERWR